MIITIDGPSASGKSTVAQALAKRLGFYYLNTGLLYRSCAFLLLRDCQYSEACFVSPQEEHLKAILDPQRLIYSYTPEQGGSVAYDGVDITDHLKTPQIAALASVIGVHPMVRDYLLSFQRSLARTSNLVAEGRDTGSVVFPDADVKFYLTADVPVRARRWMDDATRKNTPTTLQEVIAIINERDRRDKERTVSPLIVPQGAYILDNTHLTFEQTLATMLAHCEQAS